MYAHDSQITNKQGAVLGVLARLWWMLGGNVLLAFSLIFIFRNEGSFFHPADWVFWIAMATLVLVRYFDIRFFDGQTATGEQASMTNWTRYAVLLTVCSALLWALAHAANRLVGSGAGS